MNDTKKLTAFSWWDENAIKRFHKGDVRIYDIEGQEVLFVGTTLYASSSEMPWYLEHVGSRARGRVLELGLGLGCASRAICANPMVYRLLTIENNPYVIEAFGSPFFQQNIIQADAYEWIKQNQGLQNFFDLIFVDHYVMGNEDFLRDLKELRPYLLNILRDDGDLIFWIDEHAPEEDQEEYRKLWHLGSET